MKREEMTKHIFALTKDADFTNVAHIKVKELVFDASLRMYCEQNTCGNYGRNYACPPFCGTPEEMKNHLLVYEDAVVLQSLFDVHDIMDADETKKLRRLHNQKTLQFLKRIKEYNIQGRPVMAGPCMLCEVCGQMEGKECRFPKNTASCLSAYCISAEKMADSCKLPYWCGKHQVAFFSMFVF